MQSNRRIQRFSDYFEPLSLAAGWPSETPFLLLGGTGRYSILPIEFGSSTLQAWAEMPLSDGSASPSGVSAGNPNFPFVSGYFAVLSYDDLGEMHEKSPINLDFTSRVYGVRRALVFDRQAECVWETSDEDFHVGALIWSVSSQQLKPSNSTHQGSEEDRGIPVFQLNDASGESEEQGNQKYLEAVHKIIEDIRDGRFYQANFLRYFKAGGASMAALASRIKRFGGPWSALIRDGSLILASFSPERFILTEPTLIDGKREIFARAEPIKGTAARCSDLDEDQAAAERLKVSEKDNAELHMIVDLLRNDMNRISQRGSVVVKDPGSLQSFTSVHHLVAAICSKLLDGLSIGDFLVALCPGGSITGAPKREVMKAIREYEGRGRGFFMGNIIAHDRSGRLDSSILIRTLVSMDGGESFEFAAGSGIVINSSPSGEMAEVRTKCRVVTDPA